MNLQVLCDQAVGLHLKGKLLEAERLYLQILADEPANFTACHLLGVIRAQQERNAEALELIGTALKIDPGAATALLNYGSVLKVLGRLEDALASYDKALAIRPTFADALKERGDALSRLKRFEEALASYDKALAIKPDYAQALNNRGVALWNMKRFDEALASYDKALAITPHHAEALNNRGATLLDLKRPDEALASYDKALAIKPDHVEVLNNRGNLLRGMGRLEDALISYDKAIALAPGAATLFHGRARVFRDLHRFAEAVASFDRTVTLDPDFAEAYLDRGNVRRALGQRAEALADYDRAIALNPQSAILHFNRAAVLQEQGRPGEAIADYDRALILQPDLPYARGVLLNARMHAGDWRNFAEQAGALHAGVRAGQAVVLPFIYLALSDSPADLLACSAIHAKDRYPAAGALFSQSQPQSAKIRVGYVCGEFRDHAIAYLTAGLFERHDRDRFEILAFDNGQGDESPIRKRLEAGFDGFFDISGLSDEVAARQIAAEKIDILVDLNGYSGMGRTGVFARKPAPVQVSYMGFPGTMGAPYMDYILADRIVIPEAEERHYAEKVVCLPDSYWVNDVWQPVAGARPDRASQGLPEEGFVFCNFNQGYKLAPTTFAVWMHILGDVPGSVLWLLENNPDFVKNVICEAARHGVAPERLIFAETVPLERHLARLGLADLMLDSLPYNGHTTACDALRAGVPVLTCRGSAFVGRVAASLLHAVDLPELVMENWDAYRTLAVRLACDPALLHALGEKLAQNLPRTALFDTDRFRRNVEAAYITMLDIFRSGENPHSFAVR